MWLWHLLPYTVFAFIPILARACATDDDCSLNGLCVSNVNTNLSICHCDVGWFGPDCGRLDLAPATRYTGFNNTNYTAPVHYNNRGNSSWGGQIVQDQDDPELFHLLYDQFAHGCGLSGWRPTSFIARAESKNGPQGPYVWKQNVTGSFRHNAYVYWSPADDKFLLWSIGVDVPDPKQCGGINKYVESGPWSPFEILINGTNPAPEPLWAPDNLTRETVLVAEDLKIFTAPNYHGPYTQIFTAPWNTSDYSPTWTEDPFIWRDKRGHWHALAHWMIDITERNQKYPRIGAHMFARNLTGPWTFKLQEAFNSTVNFTDGSAETFNRRERPKLFFSDDWEVTPLYLVNGVQRMGTTSESYTLIQPIGTAWREFERRLGF
jgi:hypothetical protein